MPATYILALDQGTTSSRALVFDTQGNMVGLAQQEFSQLYPQAGWVEHDPLAIWQTQLHTAQKAIKAAKITQSQIAGIGITNQRETTVVWNKKTGQPIYNAIVWQDRRTAPLCDQLRKDGHAAAIAAKTGLIVDAYFSGTKLKWILDHVKGARKLAQKGELAFGTIDTWLAWQLSGGKLHITDVSNASRTMLYNIHTLSWDEELLTLLDIPPSVLPTVMPSSAIYGEVTALGKVPLPLAGIAGDQQAALFGQQCTQPGMVKNTYGTGCFMLMNTGTQPTASQNNLLTTIAWQIDGVTEYALEGSVFIGGAVVQWLRDGLGIIKKSADIEKLAAQVTDSQGVVIVPAFAGLGAPHWQQYARGTMVGVTRGTTKAHIARAALDSIAYQSMDVLKAMEADSKIRIKELRVDGGAAANNMLMQFQSDILQTKVIRPSIIETTALGAAYLAGLAVGYWKSAKDIAQQWQLDTEFSPQQGKKEAQQRVQEWQRGVNAAKAWAAESPIA